MRAPAIRVNARMLRPAFAGLGYGVSLQVRMPPSGPWSGNGGTIVFLHPIALRYKQNCGLYALIQGKGICKILGLTRAIRSFCDTEKFVPGR